jgi:hypothetical protein
MKIFIVIYAAINETRIYSVWTTRALARAAIHFHSSEAKIPKAQYSIVEREINQIGMK